MLEKRIRQQLERKSIMLMTHLVLGFPSFDENLKMIAAMANAGVELIELQIPFSEPTADGPVILKANSQSLENGTKVKDCISFARRVCSSFPEISFLFMTYYNIVFAYGEHEFIAKAKEIGIAGFIIPDLPPEEAGDWLKECSRLDLNSIFIFTPTNTLQRLQSLSRVAGGFVYCVGRRGVTGSKTDFNISLENQIRKYRQATHLPLAMGFGVQEKSDVDFLTGKADIAVMGSKLINIHEKQGVKGIESFLNTIRSF